VSLVLVVIGCVLVAVGCFFAWVNKATDSAGGSGLKSIAIEGPAWLVLIVVGCASAFTGVWFSEEAAQRKQPPTSIASEPTSPTEAELDDEFPNGFTFGDDQALDKLWRECDRGIWASCDALYFQSDEGSDYEWFGATCGGVIPDPIDFCDPTTE
jgi:hypothetical protein